MSGVRVLHGASDESPLCTFPVLSMELDLQPGDVVKVLESAALGWVRARVIRVKSGGR
ncbi:MAG: SH3 domain-containing protein, partial [Cyanobacteriota bacterium]|nr:SH3 domain-containing protein [Cyanobacteriota bacterium]